MLREGPTVRQKPLSCLLDNFFSKNQKLKKNPSKIVFKKWFQLISYVTVFYMSKISEIKHKKSLTLFIVILKNTLNGLAQRLSI